VCSSYGIGKVFVPNGWTQQQLNDLLVSPFGLIDVAASVASTAECALVWKGIYCLNMFQHCDENVPVPQRVCKSLCESVVDRTCKSSFNVVKESGFAENTFFCNDVVGNRSRTAAYFMSVYFKEWEGLPAFQNDGETYMTYDSLATPCYNGTGLNTKAICSKKSCPLPYIEVTRPRGGNTTEYCLSHGENFTDCSQCTSQCAEPCRTAIWDDSKWTLLWIIRWLPGVLCMPFSIAVIVNERNKIFAKQEGPKKKKSNSGNIYILLCACFGLMYSLMDSFPSMVMKFDMKCNGMEYFDNFESSTTHLDGHTFCMFGKYSVHVMQMLLASVGACLSQLWRKLSAAQDMRTYTQSSVSKGCWYGYIASPLILAIIHSQQDVSNGQSNIFKDGVVLKPYTDLTQANNVRYAFTCGAQFKNLDLEWGIVLGPSIVYGVVLFTFSLLLVKSVRTMLISSTSGVKSGAKADKTTVELAKTMIKFAAASTLFVALNIGTVVPYLALALKFSADLDLWFKCASSGTSFGDCTGGDISQCGVSSTFDNLTATSLRCGEIDGSAPSYTLTWFYHLSYSLPVMVFAYLFGKPAIKSLRKERSKRINPSGNTNGNSSSNGGSSVGE